MRPTEDWIVIDRPWNWLNDQLANWSVSDDRERSPRKGYNSKGYTQSDSAAYPTLLCMSIGRVYSAEYLTALNT